MADLENSERSELQSGSGNDDLPSLFGRLGDEVTRLMDLRLTLLKVELKEDVDTYVRRGVTLASGTVVAFVGLALLNVALAFFIASLFGDTTLSQPVRYALGFVITGSVYLTVGLIVVLITKSRLARQGIVPKRSVQEFEKDKQLVSSVVRG